MPSRDEFWTESAAVDENEATLLRFSRSGFFKVSDSNDTTVGMTPANAGDAVDLELFARWCGPRSFSEIQKTEEKA